MAKVKTVKKYEIVDGIKVPISKETLKKIEESDKKEYDKINALKARIREAAVAEKVAAQKKAAADSEVKTTVATEPKKGPK
jgi:hypothetical protein